MIYIWQDRRTGKSPTNTQILRQSLAAGREEATKRAGNLGGKAVMCAAATRSATRTEAKTKTTKTSKAKVEANRRNAEKSSGPKSDDAKSRMRYNALKHGMTAKTVLLPGDDPQEFAGRLRYLQDDLQARNGLEAVVIERLAGDLWKSDRSDRSFCNRINFRLRHESDEQARKEADEAVELGQHLLWMPEFPLPVGALEGEAKGALAKFPLADVPGDPKHPARLLLKLQATIAGCDWMLTRWDELRFRLENGGPWVMEDVWKMVRLLGKTGIEMKDDFQVALLVLASLALEPDGALEPARKHRVAEAMHAMSRDQRLTRVIDGITRLCVPFQQALARMPLDKLAPENAAQARQRLSAVVEEELGRIGRLRGRLQQIAEADQAEAPVRLAFETGTEGDRQRRYALSYERLVNRRIDTFLKVRKASGSGELDFAELAGVMDAEELAELVAAGGMATFQNTEDLRSGDGRGPETRAQHPDDSGCAACPEPGDLRSSDVRGLETRAQHWSDGPALEIRAQHGEEVAHHGAAAAAPGSVRVSDPTETPDRRSPLLASTVESPTAESMELITTETCIHVDDGPGPETSAQHEETLSRHREVDEHEESRSVSQLHESFCDDDSILRNEANDGAGDPVGWGGDGEGDAPGSAGTPPVARWTSQLDAGQTSLATSHGVDDQTSPQNETTAEQDEPRNPESEGSIGSSAHVDGRMELRAENPDSGPKDMNEPANADAGSPPGDEPDVPRAAVPTPADARLARLLVPMDRAALALLTDSELKARRWAMFQANQKLRNRR